MPRSILRHHVATVWMRAVANAVGYTPEIAIPLACAYVHVRRHPIDYDRSVGGLSFAGLRFTELQSGTVVEVCDRRFVRDDYDPIKAAIDRIDPRLHDRLWHTAVDIAESIPIQRLDETPWSWDAFLRVAVTLAGRFEPGDAVDRLRALARKGVRRAG